MKLTAWLGAWAILAGCATASAQVGPSSRVVAGDGRPAMDCVQLVQLASGDSRISGNGGRVLANGCSDKVEIAWCIVDEDCTNELGSSWTVDPGASWPVSAEKEIRWGACHGKNTILFEKGAAGLRYICYAEDGAEQPQSDTSEILTRTPSAQSSAMLTQAAAQAQAQGPQLDSQRAAEVAKQQALELAERQASEAALAAERARIVAEAEAEAEAARARERARVAAEAEARARASQRPAAPVVSNRAPTSVATASRAAQADFGSCEPLAQAARNMIGENFLRVRGGNNPGLYRVLIAATVDEFWDAYYFYGGSTFTRQWLASPEGMQWLGDEQRLRQQFASDAGGRIIELEMCWARMKLARLRAGIQ